MQRHLLTGSILLVPIAFWRPLLDTFSLPKITLVWLGALWLVASSLTAAALEGTVRIPRSPFLALSAVLIVALTIATVSSPSPKASFLGVYGRWTGLASYLAFVIYAAAARRHADGSLLGLLLRSLLYGGVVVSLYALVQAAGADPFTWPADDVPDVFSTLGNANFAAAFVALTLAPATWFALRRMSRPWERTLGYAAMVIAVPALVAMASLQGYIVAVVTVGMVAVGWFYERSAIGRRVLRSRLTHVGAIVGLVVVAVVVLTWRERVMPALGYGFRERLYFYDAAAAMFADQPGTGTGLDMFGRFFTRYQPVRHAIEYREAVPDAVHSVPLAMFTHGGVLLGVAYVAMAGYVGWQLIRLLPRTTGDARLLVLALGGVWVGYHLQALISIDEPPLALVHWIAAGSIVGLSEDVPGWTRRLPWAPPVPRKKGKKQQRPPEVTAPARAVAVAVLVATVLGSWLALRPAKADLAAAEGRAFGTLSAEDRRAVAESEAAFERAHELASHNGTYWFEHANTRYARGDVEGALEAQAEAARLAPGQPLFAVNAAIYALELGDRDTARAWWDEAISRDPRNPERLAAAAQFFEAVGDGDRAAELHQRADRLMSALE